MAVDRTSEVVFVELYSRATKLIAADFLHRVLAYYPHEIHKILTDYGIRFGNLTHQPNASHHIVDYVCLEHGIEHRSIKLKHL